MVFLTNKYIYTPEKQEKKLNINGIEFKSYLDDEFEIGVDEALKKEYSEFIDYKNFYDNFKVLGNVAFYDEYVLIVNDKIIKHNFLSVARKNIMPLNVKTIEPIKLTV